MFKGFYTVGSGMIAQQRRTELLSNNLANAKTPGFKEDQASIRSFPEMLLSRLDRTNIPTSKGFQQKTLTRIGDVGTGVYMQETLPNFVTGSLLRTELSTDVALHDHYLAEDPETGKTGSIFFRLANPEGGEYYTRNGNFAIDNDGYLTAANGDYVLDNEGNQIYLVDTDFIIDTDGRVIQNDVEVGKLGVAYASDSEALTKQGDGLFVDATGQMQDADTIDFMSYQTQQGYIESSNVDEGRTMTEMMTAYRAFEANSKVLQAYDRSMEKAVELGRVQ